MLMAKRSINEILGCLLFHDEMEVARLQDALCEARAVLKKVAYMYRRDEGAGELLKKWDKCNIN